MTVIKPFALTPIVLTNSIGIGAAYQDEAGYNLTTYGPFETWDNAMEFCDHVNTKLGMSREEADSIIASSMRAQNMAKRIQVTEYLCPPTTYALEEFITAQTIDGLGNPLTETEGLMLDQEIDRLRSLAVGETMPLGEPEAGLTAVRLPNEED